MDKYISRSKLKKNFDYLKVNFYLMFKNTVEYKANFYTNLFQSFIFAGINIFSFSILGSVFAKDLGWEIADYLIFTLLSFIIFSISGFFSWGKNLKYSLLKGDLNIYLTKPISVFIGHIFSNLSGVAFISFFFRFLVLISIFIYFNIMPQNILLVLFLILFLNLLNLVIYQFLESLEFILKGLSDVFGKVYFSLFDTASTYPSPIFRDNSIKFLLMVFPSFFSGSLLVPMLRGYDFLIDPILQIEIIFGLITFFGLLIWINWHYGLKKYEAFG